MEVLIRRYDGKPYVWKQAKYIDGNIVVDGIRVYENQIVSIQNDIRKSYVKCSGCGKVFKKGSPKIEKHKSPITDNHLCFGCQHLRQERKSQISQKYELLENGNYISKSKSEVRLSCGITYYYDDINSAAARERCQYNRCKNATMNAVTGFFITNPNAFDDIITIDKIIEHGYKEARRNSYDNTTEYRLKGRYNIEAIVNDLNIVESFSVSYRNKYWSLYYSKKYNKFFRLYNNTYKEWAPQYDLDRSVSDRIKEIIVSLYN